MTYGEARDIALYLIHQESIAGQVIPGSYNNQQDYLYRIPSLVNAAQMDIATTAKKIPVAIMLSDLDCEEQNGSYIYTLPTDMYQRRGSGLLVPVDVRGHELGYERFNQLRMVGRDRIIIRCRLPADTMLEYYRYPTRLSAAPADEEELDNVPEAQEAVPYYVAAHLVMQDDAFRYATLFNEYSAKKDSMMDLPTTEPSAIQDVYFPCDGDYSFWG